MLNFALMIIMLEDKVEKQKLTTSTEDLKLNKSKIKNGVPYLIRQLRTYVCDTLLINADFNVYYRIHSVD